MPYQRLKEESYFNLGGLDRRTSFFVGENSRVLELQNLTYQIPGAFTPRPGSRVETFNGYSIGVSLGISEVFFLSGAKYGQSNETANRTYTYATEMGFFVSDQFGTNVIIANGVAATFGQPTPWSTAEFIRTFAANGSHFLCVNVEQNPSTPRSYNVLDGGLSPLLPGATGLYATYSGGASAWLAATGLVRYAIGSGFFNTNDGLFAPFISTHGFNGITATTGPIVVSGITAPVDALFLYRQQGTDPGFYLLGPLTKTGSSFAPYIDYGVRTDTLAPGATFAFVPRILAEFNNALFAANLVPISSGIYAPESTVAFSALGKPAFFGATQTFQVGNDTSEPITGMYAWQNQLLIGKQRALYVLTGADARTYQLRQVSKTFGPVGPQAFGEFQSGRRLGIVGQNGIATWDGSSLDENFSARVFDYFNLPPGPYTSVGNWPERREIWFALSRATLGTSELNPPRSRLLVYDYLVDQWWESATYPGNVVAYIPQLTLGGLGPSVYFGGSSNLIFYHSARERRDLVGLPSGGGAGQAFTCIIASAFKQELGHSVEKLYRRIRTDMSLNQGQSGLANIQGGLTLLVTAQFRINGQTAIVASRTFNAGVTGPGESAGAGALQNIGISAKQLAVRWLFGNAGNETFSIVFSGYTFESRYLRST